MKKLLLSATVVAGLFAAPTVRSLQKQINSLQKELKSLKTAQQNQNTRYYQKVAPLVTNSHLFWSYDLRTSFDFIQKTTTPGILYDTNMTAPGQFTMTPRSGIQQGEKKYTGQVFSNRVILTGVAKPSENLKATVRVEANKVFGMSNINMMSNPFQNIDWIADETPDDANIRLKSAWFNWYFGDGFMFSAGRRPATEGFPANLREDDPSNPPIAHLINMEFDGFAFDIGNEEFSKIADVFNDWGTSLMFCAGRGYSNTSGKWDLTNSQPDYTRSNSSHNADFAGFILTPFNNGQYSLKSESVWAFNLQGYRITTLDNQTYSQLHTLSADQLMHVMQQYGIASFDANMPTLGNYFGENLIFEAEGIGSGMSDTPVSNFLYNTTAFVSYAFSQTRPKAGQRMLGSTDKKSGHSVWIGADMPGIGANDRFGVNYVVGSKYWRNFTYGEDTLAGSIAAVRGHAFDVYYKTQIIPHLTAQLRYTYIKYNYPGSDAFFGDMSDPEFTAFSYVKNTKDIRAYIRYRF